MRRIHRIRSAEGCPLSNPVWRLQSPRGVTSPTNPRRQRRPHSVLMFFCLKVSDTIYYVLLSFCQK